MNEVKIDLSDFVSIDYQGVELSDESPLENQVSLNGTDYIVGYLCGTKGNKGGNSYILSLYEAQETDSDNLSEMIPDKVIKILKKKDKKAKQRFLEEIEALKNCKEKLSENIIEMYEYGEAKITIIGKNGCSKKSYLFYSMEAAECDLTSYIRDNKIPLYNKIDLCVEITEGLKQLNELGYYHRDLKPDNILISHNKWKIADLGLVSSRDNTFDKVGEFIGPKGWLSPEAVNKRLTENMDVGFDCKIDHQSDIFQLGKVFWFIFQGNCPIGNIRLNDFRIKDAQLYAILKTMLSHSKTKRYKTIDEVSSLLKPIYISYFKNDVA